MTNVLIVDDEKIEREGLKYLLSREEGERTVFEAANGKQALQVLRSEDIQLLLTDIKMPHMTGLELSKKAKEENPNLQIIIFSGFSDFTFAQEAIRYGVTEYILKPVNPDDFHKVLERAESEISKRRKKESREIKEKNFLQQYFLQSYLYSGKKEILQKAGELIDLDKWNSWHCAILIESDVALFDTAEENLEQELQKELHRMFFYMNLNARQSLILFQDVYCDYQLVANHIYNFLKREYMERFYLAVSRKFDGCESLPSVLEQLEQQMEEKFYHPDKHVFTNEDEVLGMEVGEVQDSQLMQAISEDITRKDIEQLWRHFECLKEKYHDNTQYSAMYIKFVFSNVIQELFQENQFSGEHKLEHEIERLYNCRNIMEILSVTEDNIKEYEAFLERSMNSSRNEVTAVKNYIYQHYEEDLNLTGKEQERMNRLRKWIKNMKYRHKLTILLVVTALVPMTVLALYAHSRQSTMVRSSDLEDMQSIIDQTKESIDSQTAVYSSLLNYLTYSPDIEEIIKEKNIDNYTAYEKYNEIADPLLSVPKSYHDAINRIQLFARSIQVEHEYTLVPLAKMKEEWWSSELQDDVRIQWLVNLESKEVAAVRMIYDDQVLDAAICIALDYDKIFQPLTNILTEENGGMVTDEDGRILYNKSELEDIELKKSDDRDTALEKINQECAYTMAESKENNWGFYLYKSQRAISGSVRRLLLEEIPLMAACCLITLVLGLSFSRIFTRKIEELTRNMDKVNHGSREVTVSSDSEDEVGILINSFRRMMDEINRLIDEVYVNKIALKEYELKALQAQINPHFLYNTLSMMNWMAIRSNQMDISKVTLALSTFYRTALSKGEDMVTIETCIRNMEAYLEIQLTMHDYNFTVEWDIDPDIKNEKMPKLLLQPVVENAIEHGIDEKEEGDKKLFLSFKGQGDDVEIIVRDNGTGMEQEKAETLVTYQAKGYGLKNVNDRIRLLYGEAYGIRIFSEPGEGTNVIMRFPKEIRNYED